MATGFDSPGQRTVPESKAIESHGLGDRPSFGRDWEVYGNGQTEAL